MSDVLGTLLGFACGEEKAEEIQRQKQQVAQQLQQAQGQQEEPVREMFR